MWSKDRYSLVGTVNEQKIRGHLHGTMPSVCAEPNPEVLPQLRESYPRTEKGIKARPSARAWMILCAIPSTQVAVIRFKRILPKTGKEIAEAVRSIVVDIASEAAKKLLWPS